MTKIQEDTQRALNTGVNVITEMTQQNIAQMRAMVEGMFLLADKMVSQPATAVHEHSVELAQETMRNAFEFCNKIARIRNPQDWVQAQNEFLSRQSQAFAEHTKQLSQRLVQETSETASATDREARRRSEAA